MMRQMEQHAAPSPAAPGPVRVGRQAIYDRERHVYSYELLFRAHGGATAGLTPGSPSQDFATSQVISATFGDFGVDQIAGDKLLFINLTRGFFTGELPVPCAPDQVVLELLEDIEVDAKVLKGLMHLKQLGYRIAVDDYAGEEGRLPAIDIADYVKIDLEAVGAELENLINVTRMHNPRALIVVERIETQQQLDRCLKAGADLFQGYFLSRPQTMEAASLSPSQLVCLRLLRALSGNDATTEEIEKLVASDPGLSLRVLRTVSSAAYGAREEITSLRQSIVLIGRRQLSSWVVLMLLGGVTSVDSEALTTVLARAAACQKLVPDSEADVAYTAGLLSGVASALGMSEEELVETTGVGLTVRSALVQHSGAAGHALEAVLAYERENDEAVPDHEINKVSRAYLAALGTAMSTVNALGGS